MTISAKGRKKPARGTAKGTATKPAYAMVHETNLGISLAAGFLGPRFEKAAAIDAHALAGRLLTQVTVDAAQATGARGDLDYGNVAILELAPSTLEAPNTVVVPLSRVMRAVFPSKDALADFKARLEGYADVPPGTIRLAADPELFPPMSGHEPIRGEPHPGGMESSRAVDAMAGLVAGLLCALRVYPQASLAELIALYPANNPAVDNSYAFPLAVSAGLDSAGLDKGAAILFECALRAIDRLRTEEGFDASRFLAQVREAAKSLGSGQDLIEKVIKAAEDVVSLRREVMSDAFEDSDGAVAIRAFVLFVLNPGADRLLALPSRIKRIGERVFALAACLVGYRSGMAALPREMKAPTPEAFLGACEFAWSIVQRSVPEASLTRSWKPDASCVLELSLCGKIAAPMAFPPDKRTAALIEALRGASFSPRVDPASGDVSFTAGEGLEILARTAIPPVFPRQPGFALGTTIPARSAKELGSALLASSLADEMAFVRAVQQGKSKKWEWYIYCIAPFESKCLKEAVQLLGTKASQGTRDDMPAEQREMFST